MLSINISEVILTIVNFLVFLFLLKHFLYTPVIRFMDERKARMEAAAQEKSNALEAVRINEERISADRAQSRAEARRIISDSRAADEKAHSELVTKTKADRVAARKQMAVDVADERIRMDAELSSEEPALAELLAERLLDDSVSDAALVRADDGMPHTSRDRNWEPHFVEKAEEDLTDRILERARAMDKRRGAVETGMTDTVIRLREDIQADMQSQEMELAILLAEKILGSEGEE